MCVCVCVRACVCVCMRERKVLPAQLKKMPNGDISGMCSLLTQQTLPGTLHHEIRGILLIFEDLRVKTIVIPRDATFSPQKCLNSKAYEFEFQAQFTSLASV